MEKIQNFEQKTWVPRHVKTHDPKKNTQSQMALHFIADDTCIKADASRQEELFDFSTR